MSPLYVVLLLALSSAHTWAWPRFRCPAEGLDEIVTSLATDLDGNNNGVLWEADDVIAIRDVLDQNKDGCVSRQEWVFNVTYTYDFSRVLANSSFPSDVFDSCPLTGDSVQANASAVSTVSIDTFYYSTVGDLLQACRRPVFKPHWRRFKRFFGRFHRRNDDSSSDEDSSEESSEDHDLRGKMFKKDCACAAARDLCEDDPLVSGLPSCGGRGVCGGKGTLGERFQENVRHNDRDGNGIVTGPEIYQDLTLSYDTDGDDCVTTEEVVIAMTGNLNFSEAFARGRFEETGACVFQVSPFQNDTQTIFPVNIFMEVNMAAMMRVCSQLSPEEFNDNCDCAQLEPGCRSEVVLQGIPSCQQYLAQL